MYTTDFHCHKIRAVTVPYLQLHSSFYYTPAGEAVWNRIKRVRGGAAPEAMVYAINNINANPRLLPNVTLGFVILDDCLKPTTALAQVRSAPILSSNASSEFD